MLDFLGVYSAVESSSSSVDSQLACTAIASFGTDSHADSATSATSYSSRTC